MEAAAARNRQIPAQDAPARIARVHKSVGRDRRPPDHPSHRAAREAAL